MPKPAWTEEDRASVRVQWPLGLRTLDSYEANAVLDLLAGLRQDIANFLRDPNIIETPSPYLEHLLPLLRDVMEAAAQGVEARPLLPSDGPPEREGTVSQCITGHRPESAELSNARIAQIVGCTLFTSPGWYPHCNCDGYVHNTRPEFTAPLQDFLGEVAVALRWCVPWLNANDWWPGFTQERNDDVPTWFVDAVRAQDDRHYGVEAATLARALCEVVDGIDKELHETRHQPVMRTRKEPR